MRQKIDNFFLRFTSRAQILKDLRAIMYEPDRIRAHAAIQQFRTEFSHLTKMMGYLNTYYFAEGKTNWMLCERQGIYHAQINTNNYIESWHRTLKVRFFRQKRAKRVDRAIYVLSQQTAPFFFRKTVESSVGVGRVSKKQKRVWAAHDRAFEHLVLKRESGYSGSLVKPVSTDSSTLEVQSFSDPATWYKISTEPGDGTLPAFTECSCMDFKTRRQVCKHIALSMLELPGCEFREVTEPRAVVQVGLDEEVVEQQEERLVTEGESQRRKEKTELVQRMAAALLNMNVNAIDEETFHTYKRQLEQYETVPTMPFGSKRPRQRRF